MKCAVILLVCLSAAAAFSQQNAVKPASADTGYRISGVVVNALTGQPVSGATVSVSLSIAAPRPPMRRRIAPSDSADAQTTHTGADGAFLFTGLDPGKYALTAHRHGFASQAYEQHEQFLSAIVVGPDKQSTGIRFRLQPDASLSGNIVDEHNEAVAGAQVILFRRGIRNGRRGIYRDQEVGSNDQGYYHFAHLRSGQYFIAVAASPWYAEGGRFAFAGFRGRAGMVGGGGRLYGGAPVETSANPALDVAFPLTFYPGVIDSGSAEAIDIRPGQHETADFSLTAQPSAHVRVHATDSAQPNVNAIIQREAFGNVIWGQTRSRNDGKGITEISGVTPGQYLLEIRAMGPNQPNGPPLATRREIDVTGDMDINADDIPAGVSVSGTVQFQGTAPAEPIRLMLQHPDMPQIMLQVGKDGQISSEQPVAPGEYEIFLSSPDYQMTRIEVTGAKLDGQSIHVGSNDVRLALTAAKSSAQVRGVAMKDDKPFPGAMVVLVPQDMSRPLLYRRDQSDSDGSFALARIPPGTYTLIALENGWDLEWSKPEVIKPFLALGTEVRVAIDGDYHIDAKVQDVAGSQ